MRYIFVHHIIERGDKMSVTAVILVAGNSTRFGKNSNKNFEKVNGKHIVEYSIEQFEKNEKVNDIIIAAKKDEMEFIKSIIAKNTAKPITLVEGGKTRQESVYNCITKTDSDIVIIHDGARPLIKQDYINKCIEEMKNYNGATIAVKSKDTIKISDHNGVVISTTERKNTWLIQTPQCFKRGILLNAHEKYKDNENITDDCMLLEIEGEAVKLIEGDYTNIKVTTRRRYKFGNNIFEKCIIVN